MHFHLLESANERAQNRIFNIIFRVPSLDEILRNGQQANKRILNEPWGRNVILRPVYFLLARVGYCNYITDQRDSRFADQLTELGYEPVGSEIIQDQPTRGGK